MLHHPRAKPSARGPTGRHRAVAQARARPPPPALDVLSSVSRLVGEIVTPDMRTAGNAVRGLMATYREKADLIAIGAYQPGADPATDVAIAARAPIDAFLRQA